MKNLTGWRKFTLAAVALAASITLCAVGKLSGAEFNYSLALVLALYGGANVWDKKNGGHG